MSSLKSTTELGLRPDSAGKVRDIFDLGDRLLIVSSDRISAYDVILDDPIPGKGIVLNTMSTEWFKLLADITKHHLVSTDLEDFPEPFCNHPQLAGRSMLVKRAQRIDAECIVRGYLSGSGWRDYQKTGAICGLTLPPNMKESQQIAEPIFTPSTKADEGHDENIDMAALENIVGSNVAHTIRDLSLKIYTAASDYARQRGIILADTKFEFGIDQDEIILIDEVLSPDSSRFWPADDYEVGRSQDSFDKQFVRDWLDESGWDHVPPAPHLPPAIIGKTQERYREALQRLFPQAVAAVEGVAS